MPDQEADTAPLAPATLGGITQANSPTTLYAHVWNLGKSPAYRVRVEFYWFNPSLGISRSDANFIGAAYVDLADRFTSYPDWKPMSKSYGSWLSKGNNAVVHCPQTWIPKFENGGARVHRRPDRPAISFFMMAKVDKLARVTWLYHFTDSRNIPSIRKLGGLWSTAKLREMGIEFHPGGNQHSLDADKMFGMDEFVHLCFSMQHPLAYLANHDGRIEKLKWIYIDDAQSVFKLEGVRYCPEVANKSGVEHYPLEHARENFDVDALSYIDFRVGNNQARKQAVEKCEILVPDHVALKFFEERLPRG